MTGDQLACVRVPDARAMHELGQRLATVLLAGDLIILDGDLGAGKTTLVQGVGEGLQVRGPITSPTFVVARAHPSLSSGPDLVHVDAYRLASLAEIDDLDLDSDLDRVVTIVEWGAGRVDGLADNPLVVHIDRGSESSTAADGVRTVTLSGHGRWADLDWPALLMRAGTTLTLC